MIKDELYFARIFYSCIHRTFNRWWRYSQWKKTTHTHCWLKSSHWCGIYFDPFVRLLCNHLDRFKFCDAILWDTDLSFLRFDNVKLADNTTCHLSYENGIFLNYSLNLEAVFIIYLTDSEEQTKQSKNKNRKKTRRKQLWRECNKFPSVVILRFVFAIPMDLYVE